MRIEWAFYGLQSLLNFPRMKKADLRSPTKISTLRSLNQLQCGFSCRTLAAFEYLSLLLSLLVEEISWESGEVSDAAHPHGGARLGVGAEDEVVLLLPQQMPLQGLPRGAQGSQVVAVAGVLDPRAQLTL